MIETEYALIGCLIIDNFRIPEAINNIKPEDFKDNTCKKVFLL